MKMKKNTRVLALFAAVLMVLCTVCAASAEEENTLPVVADGFIDLGSLSFTEGTLVLTLKQSESTGYTWKFGNDTQALALVMDDYNTPSEKEALIGLPGVHRFVLIPQQPGDGIVSFWFAKNWIHQNAAMYTVCVPYHVDNSLKITAGEAYVLNDQLIPDTIEEQMASDPQFGSITFKSDVLELYVGKTGTQTPKASSSAISKKGYTYESSDVNVATVNSEGRVKGVSQGLCTILVKSKNDERVWARYQVKVNVQVSKVTVTGASDTLLAGEQMQLFANVEPANADYQDVTWTSSDKSLATVDENGVVTALKKGTVTIRAKSKDNTNASGSYKINITQGVTGVSVEKQYVRVGVNYNATVTAKLQPTSASNKNMTWYSSDPNICTVSGTKNEAKIVGKNWGECTITGVTEDGGYECSFTALVGSVSKAIKISNTGRSSRNGAPRFTIKNDSNLTMKKITLALSVYDNEGAGVMIANGNNPYVLFLDFTDGIDPFSSVTVDFNQIFYYLQLPWYEYSYMQIGWQEWVSYDTYTTTSGTQSDHYSLSANSISWVDIGTPITPVNNEGSTN